MPTLNDRADRVANELERNADTLRVAVSRVGGARVIDCGGAVTGSLAAGLLMARACLADLADVALRAVRRSRSCPARRCRCGPTTRCGRAWRRSTPAGRCRSGKFFAMGSGPMRAAYAKEELFQHIPGKEEPPCRRRRARDPQAPDRGGGRVTSSAELPPSVEQLTLLVAPASSLAGNVQVVARSVETALHKLHELKFDVTQVRQRLRRRPAAAGRRDELAAIGRTNDAILYGGRVTLWVRADDELIDGDRPEGAVERRRRTTGRRSRRCSPGTATSTRSTRCCSRPAEVTFREPEDRQLPLVRPGRTGAVAEVVLRAEYNQRRTVEEDAMNVLHRPAADHAGRVRADVRTPTGSN